VKFALVEVNVGSPGNAIPIEVLLASGERLRIPPGFDAATLRSVLGVLREPR